MKGIVRRAAVVVMVLAVGTAAVGCSVNQAFGIEERSLAVLLPGAEGAAENFDREDFEQSLVLHSDLDPIGHIAVEVTYFHADGDLERQRDQIVEAVAAEADVILIDPVDGPALEGMARATRKEGPMVVAYDHVVPGASFYVGPYDEYLSSLAGQGVAGLFTHMVQVSGAEEGVPVITG